MASPDVSTAEYQKGQLVWVSPSVTGGRMKGRISDAPHWDDVFKEWRYEVRITGAATYLYKKGTHHWVGRTSLSDRSK